MCVCMESPQRLRLYPPPTAEGVVKLKKAIEMIVEAVKQEDMLISYALKFPIKRLELEVELIEARDKIKQMET